MSRYAYVQTSPLMITLIPELQTKASVDGWEYVDSIMVGMMVPQNQVLPPSGQPQGAIAVVCHFRKEVPQDATELPAFPSYTLGATPSAPQGPTGLINGGKKE